MKGSFEFALSMIRNQVASSDLLTGPYARYLPLVADALQYFLKRLSSARLSALLQEQVEFRDSTSIAERVAAVLLHVPALHKLGQVIARDRRLDLGFRERLKPLESLSPRVSMAEVAKLVEAGLPGKQKTGMKLGENALAEGSVAVVVPFSWKHRESRFGPRVTSHGVLKVLKPGIEGILDEDLQILGELGCFLDEDCVKYQLPQLDYKEQFRIVRDLLMHEVHLSEEQSHLGEAAQLYASSSDVLIPKLLPFCSPTITAMERVHGCKLEDSPIAEQSRIARIIAESMVAQPLFSPSAEALFHADPHAGNLMVASNGCLAILDWSLAGRLSRQDRTNIAQLLLSALMFDVAAIEEKVFALSSEPPDRALVSEVVAENLRKVRWGMRPGLGWLTTFLDEVALRAGVKFKSDLLLFRKSLFTLEGVLADLTRECSSSRSGLLDQTVLTTFIRHWIADWPMRINSPLTFRSPSVHVSVADLVSVVCSSPLTMARWWAENSLDLMRLSPGRS